MSTTFDLSAIKRSFERSTDLGFLCGHFFTHGVFGFFGGRDFTFGLAFGTGGTLLGFGGGNDGVVWVEFEHGGTVAKRISFQDVFHWVLFGGVDNGLNFVRIDHTGQIGVGHDVLGYFEPTFNLGRGGVGTKNGIQFFESGFGPDQKSADVTSWGKRKKVQTFDVARVDTGDVAESFGQTLVLRVNDKRTFALDVTTVAHFTFAGSQFFRTVDVGKIVVQSQGTQKFEGFFGALKGLDFVGHDDRDFLDLGDTVTTCHDKCRDRRGGKSGSDGVSSLRDGNFTVPAAPDTSGGKHATTTAHITKGTGTGRVGSSSRDTRNTGDGTSSTPRSRRVIHTSIFDETVTVGLTFVFTNIGVDKVDDVGANGGREHRGEGGLSTGDTRGGIDCALWARHYF